MEQTYTGKDVILMVTVNLVNPRLIKKKSDHFYVLDGMFSLNLNVED